MSRGAFGDRCCFQSGVGGLHVSVALSNAQIFSCFYLSNYWYNPSMSDFEACSSIAVEHISRMCLIAIRGNKQSQDMSHCCLGCFPGESSMLSYCLLSKPVSLTSNLKSNINVPCLHQSSELCKIIMLPPCITARTFQSFIRHPPSVPSSIRVAVSFHSLNNR